MKFPANNKIESMPLQVNVENEQLVIRIGIETLAWAASQKNGGPLKAKIINKHKWALDVAKEIEHEDEIGDTMLCHMIDEAMKNAMEKGSVSIKYK